MIAWPPASLPGLHVDFGSYDVQASRWVREPSARYRCRCGFTRAATGVKGVASVTAAADGHRASCRHHTDRRAA